jgi:hypothetical protein
VASDEEAVEAAPPPAAPGRAELLKRLSRLEPLAVLKPWAAKKNLTESDVNDALATAFPAVQALVLSEVKSGDAAFPPDDWNAFLELVRAKKGELRTRKISAWTYEKKLERIAALSSGETVPAAASAPPAAPTPTPGPPPASREDLQALKSKLESRLQEAEQKLAEMGKEDEKQARENIDLKTALAAERQDRAADRDSQKEELRLVKNLVDNLKADLVKTGDRLEAVGKKADEKNLNDEELRQSLTIMRKDLHDNVQDVSVMKQKVEKLMAPEKQYARPLDKALGSKWVPGAALLISLGAIVLAASKK